MSLRTAFCLVVLLAAGGCLETESVERLPDSEPTVPVSGPTSDERAAPAERPGDLAERRPGARLDRILADRPDDGPFLSGLRSPRRRTAEPAVNRRDPARTDTVVTLIYDGLSIEAYAVTGGPTHLRRLAVTSGEYGTASGLSVGETRASIESVLGPAVRTDEGNPVYELAPDEAPTLVTVTYEPDQDGVARASEIVWAPYLD